MSRTISLSVHASVILDGSGNGTAGIGPTATGEVWQAPLTASVKASTNTAEATCKIYAGNGTTASDFADGTTWGSTGDSTSQIVKPVYLGQQVFAVWTGGDPGATATLTVTGTRSVP